MTSDEPGSLPRTVTRRFLRSPAHIPLARSFVRDTLAAWGNHGVDTRRLHDLVLMTSELFTNAVLHGDGEVEVSISLRPDAVRLAVCDEGGQGVPRSPLSPPEGSISGRGLRIVAQLASAWGSDRDRRGGTMVWLEVARP